MLLHLYDRQLRKAICAYCVVQPEHKGHDCVPLHEVAEQAQAELEACMAQAKEAVQAMRASEAENRSALQGLDVAVAAAEAELHTAGEQVWDGKAIIAASAACVRKQTECVCVCMQMMALMRARVEELSKRLQQGRKAAAFEMGDNAERLDMRCAHLEEALQRAEGVKEELGETVQLLAAVEVRRAMERELAVAVPGVTRAEVKVAVGFEKLAAAVEGWGSVAVTSWGERGG
jgi:hypothetical protein